MTKTNFNPGLWGGSAWTFLHYVALSYPNNPTSDQRQSYRSFFLSLDKVLPCEKCCVHFRENNKKHNIDKHLSNSDDLFSWTIKIRNEVQKILNKPLFNEKQMKEFFISQSRKSNNKYLYYITIFIVIISSIYLLKKYKKNIL